MGERSCIRGAAGGGPLGGPSRCAPAAAASWAPDFSSLRGHPIHVLSRNQSHASTGGTLGAALLSFLASDRNSSKPRSRNLRSAGHSPDGRALGRAAAHRAQASGTPCGPGLLCPGLGSAGSLGALCTLPSSVHNLWCAYRANHVVCEFVN